MKKTSKSLGRIFSIVLCMSMLASMGSVFAQDVGSDSFIPENMVLAASYTVDLGDGNSVVKELYLSPDKSSNLRGSGFSDIRYGSVSHSYYANNGQTLSLRMSAYASFNSQLGVDMINLGTTSYTPYESGTHWQFYTISEERVTNHKPLFGERYAQYSVRYTGGNGQANANDTAWKNAIPMVMCQIIHGHR